jgi:hypothetical protein
MEAPCKTSREVNMNVVHARCCGIDVHQASLAVCVSIKEEGKSETHKLVCGPTTKELFAIVGLESVSNAALRWAVESVRTFSASWATLT